MTPKLTQSAAKPASSEKSARKVRKGAAETSRLFIDVDEIMRRPQMSLTRYVE